MNGWIASWCNAISSLAPAGRLQGWERLGDQIMDPIMEEFIEDLTFTYYAHRSNCSESSVVDRFLDSLSEGVALATDFDLPLYITYALQIRKLTPAPVHSNLLGVYVCIYLSCLVALCRQQLPKSWLLICSLQAGGWTKG